MFGHIRAKGKCPICDKAFTEIPKIGYLCLEHQTVPKRFYVDVPWKGKRIRIFSDKTGQVLDSYDRTDRIRERIESEIEDHTFDPAKYVTAEASKFWVVNLLDRFEKDKIETIAPAYKKDYRRMVRIAKDYFGKRDAREIRKLDLIDYMKYCQEKFTWKEKTLKNNMDLFKVFINYLKNDLEIINAVPEFPSIEVPVPQITWLHSGDQIQLYDLVPDEDKPIVAFLMLHGCRPGEARAIKCKDVDPELQTVNIHATFSKNEYRTRRKGRGSRPYVIAIHPEIVNYVTDRARTSHPEAFLFINPRTGGNYTQEALLRVWDNVRKAAEIDKSITLYSASRHSFVSQLINLNISSSKIGQLTGHSSPRMIEQRYAHHDLESLRGNLSLVSLKKSKTVTRLPLKKKDEKKSL